MEHIDFIKSLSEHIENICCRFRGKRLPDKKEMPEPPTTEEEPDEFYQRITGRDDVRHIMDDLSHQ